MIFAAQFFLSDEMAPTKKEKVTFTCTAETKQALEAWAEGEGRTVSNLVERIVLAALTNQNQQKQE
jgi:hypothetical protein